MPWERLLHQPKLGGAYYLPQNVWLYLLPRRSASCIFGSILPEKKEGCSLTVASLFLLERVATNF